MRICAFLFFYFSFFFCYPILGQNTVKGIVTYQGETIAQAKVFIKGYEDNYVLTNSNGKFFLELPEIELEKLDCYVNPEGTQLRQLYEIPNKTIGFVDFKLNYLKDPRESLIADTKEPSDKQKEEKAEPKIQTQLTEVNQPKEEEKDNIPEEKKEEEETQPKEEVEEKPRENLFRLPKETRESLESEDIQSDIETLTKELDKEQKRMIERNKQIRNEIENITDRLQNSIDLTPEKKEELINQLDALEDQLFENSKRFTELQDLTLSQIDQMRNQLGDERKKREQSQRIIWILLIILGIVVILLLVVFLISRKIIKQRNQIASANTALGEKNHQLEEKNQEIAEKNQEIAEKNQEITDQMMALALKNKETEDSIRAAEVIQKSILPSQQQFKNYFKEYFIIYRPKDIVSGDFYWMVKAGRYTFIAVVDCTGHGVPGAFMSMIGNSLLNDIVIKQAIFDPAEILDDLQMALFARLGSDNQDGMDICLVRIESLEEEKKTVLFCGAKRPLFIYKNNKLENIKGIRKGIGGVEQNSDKEFKNSELILEQGDALYLTTDGYVDTPGPDRRSFGTRRLLKLLDESATESMEAQKQTLLKNLEDYQQNEEARDDLTFIGLRI